MVMPESKFKDFGDVVRILGLPVADEYTSAQLVDAYNGVITGNLHKKKDIRLAYKLARDPFYQRALTHYGSLAKVEEAGFFDDELPPGLLDRLFDPKLQTTSLEKVKAALLKSSAQASERPNIVLLTTGAFAPIHEGHLEMMEAARMRLSAEGFGVVGGFIAPAHDYYVRDKGEKADLWNGERRLTALNRVLEKSDWLEVDPWMLHNTPTDLMFTDVILRMDAYLRWNLPTQKNIEVTYVFGGDHVAHARTFLKYGMGICVNNRKGYENDLAAIEQEFAALPNHRMFFIQTNVSERSSGDIRLGKQPLMDVLANSDELQAITDPSITPEELSNRYMLTFPSIINSDQRGSINQTWFIGTDFVLTIFQNRTYAEVEAVSKIVERDTSGLLPKAINGNTGPVCVIHGKPAILWHHIHGLHLVEQDHSQKIAVPEAAHSDIAESFWKIHAALNGSFDLIPDLGVMDYQAIMKETQAKVGIAQLPEYLRRDFVLGYLQTSELPLKYPALVHTDMERHNLLHDRQGKVLGVVDVDAIMGGDILYEYAHLMMNFVFTDPAYKTSCVDAYLEELNSAGMVKAEDISLLPAMIRLFAAEDLLYYHQHDQTAKTDLSRLAAIYETAIERADSYFVNLNLAGPDKPAPQLNAKQEPLQPK
jgi:nicotinic acid mononucleotide adenylyltransferase